MTNLECSVHNCAANYNDLCSLDKIDVKGAGATQKSATSCASFREQSSSMTNSMASGSADPQTNIVCDANTCRYNASNMCHASSIKIAGDGASDSYLTRCANFERG